MPAPRLRFGEAWPDAKFTAAATGLGCCTVGDYTSRPMRLGLRAKLEQEREERPGQRKASIGNGFHKLFGQVLPGNPVPSARTVTRRLTASGDSGKMPR